MTFAPYIAAPAYAPPLMFAVSTLPPPRHSQLTASAVSPPLKAE